MEKVIPVLFHHRALFGRRFRLVVPGTGVFLQNRGALFSQDPAIPTRWKGGNDPITLSSPGCSPRMGIPCEFWAMGALCSPQAHLQVPPTWSISALIHNSLDLPRFRLNADIGKGVGAEDAGGRNNGRGFAPKHSRFEEQRSSYNAPDRTKADDVRRGSGDLA